MYKIHNNQVGSFVRVLGADKENIYYEYLHNSEYYYACVDFELKDVVEDYANAGKYFGDPVLKHLAYC